MAEFSKFAVTTEVEEDAEECLRSSSGGVGFPRAERSVR